MRRALFTASLLGLALVAGCTVPQYDCGHWVPCARGSVQSCVRTDRTRCHYLFSDGTIAECASCDDCSAAENDVVSWCLGDPISTPDLTPPAPRDMSVAGDLACYPWGTVCNGDPWCCPKCCAGHCDGSGACAEQ